MRKMYRLVGSSSKLRAHAEIDGPMIIAKIHINWISDENCKVVLDNQLEQDVPCRGYLVPWVPENVLAINCEYEGDFFNIRVYYPLDMKQIKWFSIGNTPQRVNGRNVPMDMKMCFSNGEVVVFDRQKLQQSRILENEQYFDWCF